MASILIVDDHLLNRQFLLSLLGYGGHRLFEAADGAVALDIARAERPDLVISDILMPKMDGYEFVTRLRADPALAETPVIFYTATYRAREANMLAAACGVKWVLPKPSEPEAILHMVQQALGLPVEAAVPPPLVVPEMAKGRILAVGDPFDDCLQDLKATRMLLARIAERGQSPETERDDVSNVSQRLLQSLNDLQSTGLRLTALIELGINLAAERDPADLLKVGCHAIQHICTAKYAMVGVLDDDGTQLADFHCRGLDDAALARLGRPAPRIGILGTLLDDRAPHLVNGLDGDPKTLGLPPEHPPVHSFLGVAVASSGRVYGWIYVVDKLGAPGFDETEKQAAATIAAQLAVAYENLIQYDEIQRHHAQLRLEMAERQRILEQLHEREAGLRRAQLLAKLAHVITGPDGSFESWSATLPQLIGVDDTSMPPTTRAWMNIVEPADRGRFRDVCIAAGKTGKRMDVEYRIRRRDGVTIHVQQVMDPLEKKVREDGRMCWFNTIQDITEYTEQQRRIARLSRISAVLSGINSAIVRIHQRDDLFREACRIAVEQGAFGMAWIGIVDWGTLEGKVVAWHGGEDGYVQKIEFTPRAGTPNSDRPACVAVRENRPVICNDISSEPTLASLRDDLLARGHRAVAAFPIQLNGRVEAVIALFGSEAGMFDEEELKLLDELAGDLSFGMEYIDKEERLNYLAFYDALTGLPNSMLFNDRLAQLLSAATGSEDIAAAILINLDHFSQLNDALGRHAGDAALKMVAQRLQANLQEPYSLARIGGDIFAIAIPGLQKGADASALVEQHILEPISRPFMLADQEVRISAHAGIALFPDDGRGAEILFKHAEVALKKAKSSGERCLYYAPHMNAAIAARMALESALRTALETWQFEMHYQPRVDLLSGRIVGAEALIRWRHPERGIVGPTEFIPLAEETGLIVPMGEWVIDTVCGQQAVWKARETRIVPVAINLSAVQFKRGKVQTTIREAIARHGLKQQDIEFELTESVVMDDPEVATRQLQELKSLGVQLSLDDFGTGYSSLAYLRRFPFDFVKIDRAFISDVTNSPGDAAIATAVIAMAHSLGLRVVAEGVETEGQLQFLRRHRCDELQGFYFSPAVPAAEFDAMLRENKRLVLVPEPAQREDTLLIVDDEPSNLSSLRRLLRQEGYRVLTAASGHEGLELLAVNSVQVIVADQRMPRMSGSQFLGIVKNLYPDTIRIILSGYTDLDAVTDSVNQGAVYKFLTKPWDDGVLREHIRDAFRRYRPRG